jgi:hypothetical protein
VFTALDPVENGNRYQYVSANPTNFADPSGMLAATPATWDACYFSGGHLTPCQKCCSDKYNVWIDPRYTLCDLDCQFNSGKIFGCVDGLKWWSYEPVKPFDPFNPPEGMGLPPDFFDSLTPADGSYEYFDEPCSGIAIATYSSLGPSAAFWMYQPDGLTPPPGIIPQPPCPPGTTCYNTVLSQNFPPYEAIAILVYGLEIYGLGLECLPTWWVQ